MLTGIESLDIIGVTLVILCIAICALCNSVVCLYRFYQKCFLHKEYVKLSKSYMIFTICFGVGAILLFIVLAVAGGFR